MPRTPFNAADQAYNGTVDLADPVLTRLGDIESSYQPQPSERDDKSAGNNKHYQFITLHNT